MGFINAMPSVRLLIARPIAWLASALSVPSALKYGPPMPKNAKPLVAPIFRAVTLPVFGVVSEVDTVLGVSSFSKAKSARRKTNWSIVISALPLTRRTPVAKSIGTTGSVSSGPVLMLSLPPASFVKSTAFGTDAARSVPVLSSTASVPERVSVSTPTSEAVPLAFSAV